jgi:hypothetical protein
MDIIEILNAHFAFSNKPYLLTLEEFIKILDLINDLKKKVRRYKNDADWNSTH